MTLDWTRALPAALLFLSGGAYLSNEWSHGHVSEALGLGHHHLHEFRAEDCPPDTGRQPAGDPHAHIPADTGECASPSPRAGSAP